MTEMRGVINSKAAASADAGEQSMVAVMGGKEDPLAKRWLLDERYAAAEVEAMPVAQALGLYHVGQFERWTQELDKGLSLPFWQGIGELARAEDKVRSASKENPWSLLAIFTPTGFTA